MPIEFTIDSKKVTGKAGDTVLDVAKAHGIDIPTLCHHKAVPSWGGCRLCIVEIKFPSPLMGEGQGEGSLNSLSPSPLNPPPLKGGGVQGKNTAIYGNGRTKIVTSCLYPIKEGLQVSTNSPKILKNRRMILNLLMAQAPAAKEVQALAKKYGVEPMSLVKGPARHKCIMCGLCTRLCAAQEAFAISTVSRGPDKSIETFWKKPPDDCIGCLICASNCPTGAIDFKEKGITRHIWNKDFTLEKCTVCGATLTLTKEQVKHYSKRSGLKEEYFTECEDCRRNGTARKFLDIIHDPSGEMMKKWNATQLPPLKMPSPTKEWKEMKRREKAESDRPRVIEKDASRVLPPLVGGS